MSRSPNNRVSSRERIARRRKQIGASPAQSAVLAGPRRSIGGLLGSGKLLSLALLIASTVLLAFLAADQRFVVRDIRVSGTQALRAEDVIGLTDARDRSIWLVDTGRVAQQLRQSAYVETASATLLFPNRLDIVLTERRPKVRWNVAGINYLVDATGKVLGTDTAAVLTDTLVIQDRSIRPLQANDQVDPDAIKLSQILALRLAPETGMTPASIGWDMGTGVFVLSADSRTIIFGQTDNLDQKIQVLHTLVQDGTAYKYLDLRPTTPFYTK